MPKRKLQVIAQLCVVACLLIWIPNIVFQISSPLWILIFIIAPIGVVLAIWSKSYWTAFLNLVMFLSFFILMGLGYMMNS